MPIARLLQNGAFGSEEIKIISAAYDDVLTSLGLIDRTDPLTQIVAEKVIECAQAGERDRTRLRDCVLQLLRD